MVDWQITAATFRCETVNDEVTLLVNKDWTVKCTGYMKITGKKNRHHSGCAGPECKLAVEYRNKLQAEEAVKSGKPG
jgi:hypothetical protein